VAGVPTKDFQQKRLINFIEDENEEEDEGKTVV